MSSPRRRIEQDVMKLMMSGYEVTLINDNIQELCVKFTGPKNTPFENGQWNIHVELPDQYPYKSPSIGFMNKIYHPNVDELSGSVCLDVINQTWSPMFDLVNVFEVFLPQLLTYPNPTDPLNGEAAALMLREPEKYSTKVRDHVGKYASSEAFVSNTAASKTTTGNGLPVDRPSTSVSNDVQGESSNDLSDLSSLSSFSDDEVGNMEI